MAMRNLEVVITVVDKASKQLDNVGKKVRQTGQQARKASVDFTAFNRTLFATTAFVGTFVKAFQTLSNSLDQGSQLDRLERQYERVLGPKGTLFDAIAKTTDASIDKMEAMRQGISLANLGIIKSSDQAASVFSKAGVAAKMAGKDSGEGIKQYSDFLKDGSVSHLQFLNLIAQTNPALQAQMAILGKAGGMMGQVVSTQARLAMGQALLNAATKGNLKGFRDLRDIVQDVKQNFTLFRQETGVLLGKALSPLLEKLNDFLERMTKTVEHIRKNEKNLVWFTKAVVVTTGAIIGLAGALGTLRLAAIALGSIGFGLPRLVFLVLSLGSAFLGITKPVDSLVDKFKLFSAFVRGIFQLVNNLDPESGFSKMDKSIHDMLKKNGLLELAQNIARVISVVSRVVKDVVGAFKWMGNKLDDMFGGMISSAIKFLSNFNEPWSKFWVTDSITPLQKFVRAATVILGGFFAFMAGKKLFGALGGLLSKIPVIGKLFGGGGMGGGPKGTATDPIYTVQAGGISGGLIGGAFGKVTGPLKSMIALLIQSFKMDGLKGMIKNIPMAFSLAFPKLAAIMGSAFSFFAKISGSLVQGLSAVGRFLTSGLGSVFSRLPGMFTSMLSGLSSILSSSFNFFAKISGFLMRGLMTIGSGIVNGLGSVFSGLAGIVSKLPAMLSGVFGFFGRISGFLIKGIASVGSGLISGLSSVFSGITGMLMRLPAMLGAAGPIFAVAAAGLLGVAIGNIVNGMLDKYTQGKTEEGFEGNIIEQGMFKLFADGKTKQRFKDIESFKNKSDVDLVNDHRAKTGKPPLTDEQIQRMNQSKQQGNTSPVISTEGLMTPTSTPAPVEADMEVIDALGEQLKSTQNSNRMEQQKSFEAALSSGEDMSKYLTKDQAYDAFLAALENSKNLSEVAGAFKNRSSQVNPMSKRNSTSLNSMP